MKIVIIFFLVSAPALGSAFDPALPSILNNKICEQKRAYEESVGLETKPYLPNSRVAVIIPGYFNEYRLDDHKLLEEYLATKPQIQTVIRLLLPSENRVNQNGKILAAKLREIYDQHQNRPIIAVAHSKGATELAYSLLFDPKLVTDNIVDRAVLLNAAFGSGLASFTSGICENKITGKIVMACKKVRKHVEGLKGLKRAAINQEFENLISSYTSVETKVLKDILKYKINYVLAETSFTKAAIGNKLLYTILRTTVGPNDSMVALKDQKMDGFGSVFPIVFQADHNYYNTNPDKMPSNHLGKTLEFYSTVFQGLCIP